MFEGRTLLISGGTGSFGTAVLNRFIHEPFDEIRIFSRDEKKQEDQRNRFSDNRLSYYIGDVRDRDAVRSATRGVDFIFHAAALKQVPSCEFHPSEAVRTNVLGTENIIEGAIINGVSRVVCLSTDKAVYPINAMGISKALMEKVMVAKARTAAPTTVCATRYGNVLASRGSVVPLFVKQALENKPLTITDPQMTRFVMTLPEAIDLVLHAFTNAINGDLFVQKAPGVTINDLADAVLRVLGKPDHPKRIIGTRHGEKKYETLLSREEYAVAEDQGNYFRLAADYRDLNYAQYEFVGERRLTEATDFNSENTKRLDVATMAAVLADLDYMKDAVAGRSPDPSYD
jgi:UDP-glucose 4-epimerase